MRNCYRIFLFLAMIILAAGCTNKGEAKEVTEQQSIPYDTAAANNIEDSEGNINNVPALPNHTAYSTGVILPSVPEAERDSIVIRLYDEWKQRYFRSNPYNPDEAYVHWDGDEGITVSEAHGYGMLIIAAMYGYDELSHMDFDRMTRYYLAHPSEINPALMAWQQDDDGEKIIDINGVDSATDGDLDIAYAFLMADKLWGSDGEFNYRELAERSINATMESIVNKSNWVLKIGDWASDSDKKNGATTRPSDFMLQHFKSYEAVTGDSRWNSLSENILIAINDLHKNHAPNTGLMPNFAKLGENGFEPTESLYSWDACRTPWRIAMDYIINGDESALECLRAMNTFIRQATSGNPSKIVCGYQLDGTPSVTYLDPAFSAPFMVSAMVEEGNQQWLDDLWAYNAAQKTYSGRYYDNSIRMLCMIVASGNWWAPESY